MKNIDYDFCGWATKNDIPCSDGRTIRKDAFAHNDGDTVPLVWNHQHNDPVNVLGHAYLENRENGVYTYAKFNDTEAGQNAKLLVQHGDVTGLSIYANKLKQKGGDVLHGAIREVSLVLAGANPGAYIENVLSHGEESDEEAIIFSGEEISLSHSESKEEEKEDMPEEAKKPAEESGETIKDIYDSLSEKQKTVVNYIVGKAVEDAKGGSADDEGEEEMKHNLFENEYEENVLAHADVTEIIEDARRYGSLKESVLAHSEATGTTGLTYGIGNIDYLYPDARTLNSEPEFIKRETEWVKTVMQGVHHTPFSRIKSVFADITEDEARAKGYTKGNKKIEEVIGLLKRTTTPTTIYKKQKMDRDDILDITDFNVVAWLKGEMRIMLDEEIARAILVGDGRLASSNDKINELNIRPIWKDDDLFTVKTAVTKGADETATAKAFIKAAVKARKNYKGSGNPVLFTTEDMLTDMLLIEDTTGRIIYDTMEKLQNALRVSKIVTVEVMENLTRQDDQAKTRTLGGIIVNLNDYNVGADKGGEVNMFDDFDIDYNQQKYLIETRCSGALTKPFSAIALEFVS